MIRIAVASGKGGTGKTTIAVALARSAEADLLDCDVEAPNAALFYPDAKPTSWQHTVPRPLVDDSRCTVCGACVEFCRFGALAKAGRTILVFEELCHACGGCALVCPVSAIFEVPSPIGTVTEAPLAHGRLVTGELAIGQTLAPPLIRAVWERGRSATQIIDAPPGTSCPMVSAIAPADFVVLVTENTPFGIHDLGLAAEVVRHAGLPHGVVINRSDIGPGAGAAEYCRDAGLPVLLEIPFDPAVARACARGDTILDASPRYAPLFRDLLATIGRRVQEASR